MKIRVGWICLLLILAGSAGVATAQDAAPEKTGKAAQTAMASAKPGVETQKLAVYVGKWDVVGNVPAGAMASAGGGKTHGSTTCEWIADGWGVMCRENIPVPGSSPLKDVYVMAYDDTSKDYFFAQVNVGGGVMSGHGTLDGDTWTWKVDMTVRGKPYHARFTEKFTSHDAFEFKNEIGESADAMMVMMDGKEARVKAVAAGAAKKEK